MPNLTCRVAKETNFFSMTTKLHLPLTHKSSS